MGVLGIVLLVLFCIVAALLIFLVAVQDENSVGLGGIFGGSSESAFGSGSANFITKATTVLAVIFMVLSLIVAVVNKTGEEDLTKAIAAQSSAQSESTWYQDNASSAAVASN